VQGTGVREFGREVGQGNRPQLNMKHMKKVLKWESQWNEVL